MTQLKKVSECVPLMHVSTSVAMTGCLDYNCFAICLGIWYFVASNLLIMVKIILAIQGFLCFHLILYFLDLRRMFLLFKLGSH